MHWIGLDIGKRTIDVALPLANGKYDFKRINNDERGFEVLVERHLSKYRQTEMAVVCETTGIYYFPIFDYLTAHDFCMSAVNPMVIKNFSRTILQKQKTDKADARMIAEFGRIMQPDFGTTKSPEIIELQRLMNIRRILLKQRTQMKGMMESIAFYQPKGCESSKNCLLDLQEINHERIKKIERTIQEFALFRFELNFKRLVNTVGIGQTTAWALICYTDNFQKFQNIRELTAYAGLAPRQYESGTSVYKSPKIAPSYLVNNDLRVALIQAANVAKRHNPECKRLFERIPHNPNGNGRGKADKYKLRVVAVARKLLRIAWGTIKKVEREQAELAGNQVTAS